MKRTLIGHFGVDSGQFVIMDPTYISMWKDSEFEDIRRYQNADGKILQYTVDFPHYEAPIASEDGRTMNQLIASCIYRTVPNPPPAAGHQLDYNSACQRTLTAPWGGELGNSMAVACRTAFGDGTFPVYRIQDDDGTLLRVEIDFTGEEE